MEKPVTLSAQTRAIAEKRAREEGFASVDAYVNALVEEYGELSVVPDWLKTRIEEGLASPSAGELTRSKLKRLVEEGIARVR